MSWKAHGTSNDELIDTLVAYSILRTPSIIHAMRATDRIIYVLNPSLAYLDSPAPLIAGATISAPHMHSHALELLENQLRPGAVVIDVGSGSGYLTTVFAHLVQGDQSGKVIGIDHIPELVEMAINNVKKDANAKKLLENGVMKFIVGDGRQGWSEGAPYDVIHVGAAAEHVPEALIEQLREGGRLVCPVGPEGEQQRLVVIDKAQDGSISRQDVMGVVYVGVNCCLKSYQIRGRNRDYINCCLKFVEERR